VKVPIKNILSALRRLASHPAVAVVIVAGIALGTSLRPAPPAARVPPDAGRNLVAAQDNSAVVYDVPVEAGSPWPIFRHDPRNTGEAPLPSVHHGGVPWSFRTAASLLSTPVIDAAGIAYIGSNDRTFYAVEAGGAERWRFRTSGAIDSAAALLKPNGTGIPTAVFGSSDGHLYRLDTRPGIQDPATRQAWAFDASQVAAYNNRFEGGVTVGHDGTLYAANSNANDYAINHDGSLRWTHETTGGNWSAGAFGGDGTIFWTSSDGYVRAVNPDGSEKWAKRTWGAVAASAAIGSDGTVYVGSFDSYFYALDPDNGGTRWTLKTGDHIVSSAALGHDATGRTAAIYFGSTDGHLYAVDPNGEILWTYDTGDPIRSSPAIGLGPGSERPGIVYVGSGNGRLYALNAADGQRRWSFDTTPVEERLRDRNDLNGSVALGSDGVYIGSESGDLWHVPYDYCLHAADKRCSTAAGEDLPTDGAEMVYVSPGGTTYRQAPPPVSPATGITLRLMVRDGDDTVDAHLCNTPLLCSDDDLRIQTEPAFKFRLLQSPDGRHVHVIPQDILEPGRSYRIRAEGTYRTGGIHFGNLTIGGSRAGSFTGDVTIQTRNAGDSGPLSPGHDQVPALEWTRLALPVPAMLASLNQTSLDGMEWILSVVDARPSTNGRGHLIVWGVGAKRDERGILVVDPESTATLALSGAYSGSNVALSTSRFTASVGGIGVPVERLRLRGQFGPNLEVQPDATLFAEADALSIPGFGTSLVAMGLANRIYDKVVAAGTYMTKPHTGSANKRPTGLQVRFVEYAQATDRLPGQIVAHFRLAPSAPSYRLADHRFGILLIDRSAGEVVPLDYDAQLSASADSQGEVSQVVLTVPAGMKLSHDLGIIVLADAFPLHREKLEYRTHAN